VTQEEIQRGKGGKEEKRINTSFKKLTKKTGAEKYFLLKRKGRKIAKEDGGKKKNPSQEESLWGKRKFEEGGYLLQRQVKKAKRP